MAGGDAKRADSGFLLTKVLQVDEVERPGEGFESLHDDKALLQLCPAAQPLVQQNRMQSWTVIVEGR